MSGVLLVGNVGFLLWTIFDTTVVFKSVSHVGFTLSDARRAVLVWKNHEVEGVVFSFQAPFILVDSENKRKHAQHVWDTMTVGAPQTNKVSEDEKKEESVMILCKKKKKKAQPNA